MMTETKYVDDIYDYKGLWDAPSKCGLKIIRKSDEVIVIATDLYDKNPGTSVTDCCAMFATKLCEEKNINHKDLVFIEHTPDLKSKLSFNNETFYRVEFDWSDDKFCNPKWQSVSKKEINDFIEIK